MCIVLSWPPATTVFNNNAYVGVVLLPVRKKFHSCSPGKEEPGLGTCAKSLGQQRGLDIRPSQLMYLKLRGQSEWTTQGEINPRPQSWKAHQKREILLLIAVSREIRQGSVDPLMLSFTLICEVKETDQQWRGDASRPAEADIPGQPATRRPLWLPW